MAEARRPRGQLRDDILDVTARLIAERGDPTSVSIDDVVRAVDCTPPSLYYYFPTKDHLVYASCQRQYERFAAAIESSLPEVDARERLLARGRAYLDWALDNPGLYRALFLHRPPTPSAPAGTARDPQAAAGLRELIANVAQAMAAGSLVPGDPLTVAFQLWATVHGVASPAVVNPDLPRELAEATLEHNAAAVLRYETSP